MLILPRPRFKSGGNNLFIHIKTQPKTISYPSGFYKHSCYFSFFSNTLLSKQIKNRSCLGHLTTYTTNINRLNLYCPHDYHSLDNLNIHNKVHFKIYSQKHPQNKLHKILNHNFNFLNNNYLFFLKHSRLSCFPCIHIPRIIVHLVKRQERFSNGFSINSNNYFLFTLLIFPYLNMLVRISKNY